jgi:RNA polymerase sigma-70 factor (ECF subfamily)
MVRLSQALSTPPRRPVAAVEPSRESPDDARLMSLVAAGDERALSELYDRHAPLVFSLAAAIVGGDADAEEVTEDVFVQIWNGARRFDPERGAMRGWLATITRSRALDLVRVRRRRQGAHERSAAADEAGLAIDLSQPDAADDALLRREARVALEGALALLNEDQRRAIELAYFGGLSQSEIARRLDEPLGTVKTRIRDGMKKLRDALAPSRARLT